MIGELAPFEGFNITFNTNEDCNLKCKYCYEIDKKHRVLNLEDAKSFIDIILTDDNPCGLNGTQDEKITRSPRIILDFIGGDALMHPELVDSILDYWVLKSTMLNHRWRHSWRVSISTNGTLFGSKEVRDFIYKWKDCLSIGVSLDGCPEIHDLNRITNDGKGSMQFILKDWEWFLSVYGESGRQTKATLNKQSIPFLYDSLRYLHEEMGIKFINMNFAFEDTKLTEDDLKEFDRQMELCVEYVLQHKDDLYWSMIKKELTDASSYQETIKRIPNSGWCGSGAMPALSVTGDIYPCFRFLPHTQTTIKDFCVGNVKDGLSKKENFKIIRDATRERISPEKCKQCEVESACAWCIAGGLAETGTLSRQTYICEITKKQVKWAKEYWKRYESL